MPCVFARTPREANGRLLSDVIRVGDTYYMVCTTMFVMPGGLILKSKYLCHWELVSYIFNTIEDNDIYHLNNGKNAYGKGQWATSLKFYNGLYYACFVCNDMQKTYIYYTDYIFHLCFAGESFYQYPRY